MLIREIEIFRAVMTAGSASKAARLLNVSQPAISQSLRKLEDHAGIPLFQRLHGKLYPTQEAAALLAEVNRCFVGMDAIEHRIRSLSQFGVKVTVSLQIMSSRDVRARLLANEADIGLIADEVSLSGLEHSVFARFDGVVALPLNHPLARKNVISPSDLAAYPFVGLNPEDGAGQRLAAIFTAHGIRPNTVVETPFTNSLCELVRHGVGVSVVNPVTAFDYVRRDLVLRRFSEKLEYTCILAMPAGKPLTAFAQHLLSVMRTRLHAELSMLAESLDNAGVL
jgi:DNA-binding transcriptional LysR family regulator